MPNSSHTTTCPISHPRPTRRRSRLVRHHNLTVPFLPGCSPIVERDATERRSGAGRRDPTADGSIERGVSVGELHPDEPITAHKPAPWHAC